MPDACGFHMLLQLCAKTFAKLSHRALAKSKHDLHLVPGSDFALEVVGSDLSEGRRRIDAAGNDSMGFTNPHRSPGCAAFSSGGKKPLALAWETHSAIRWFTNTPRSASPRASREVLSPSVYRKQRR